jgi:hypothetical protein
MADRIISKVTLTPSFELSTEHAASSYGQPVLVNRASGEAFGPADIVKPYPSWEFTPASKAVDRMARTKKFTYDEQKFLDSFINFSK